MISTGALLGMQMKVIKMKKKWFICTIMALVACLACSCGGDKKDSGNGELSQESSSSVFVENSMEGSGSQEESSGEESREESSSEDSLNGGVMEGDNDLNWGNSQE